MIVYQPPMCIVHIESLPNDPGRNEVVLHVDGQPDFKPWNVSDRYVEYLVSEPHPIPLCPPASW